MSQPPGFGSGPQWPQGPGAAPGPGPWGPAGPAGPPQGPPTQSYPTTPLARGPQFDGAGPRRQQPEPRNTKKIALIVAAAVLALALVIVGAVLFRNHQQRVAQERAAEAARIAEEERKAEQGRQELAAGATAQGFLEALAGSDAEKALALAAEQPTGNSELLSRDVLLEANKRAALTGVVVDATTLTEESPGVWNTGTAAVRYSIGDQPQTVDLPLRRVAGEWKVDQVSAAVDLGSTGPDRKVNGVTVKPGVYNLFPGSYSVTSANPLVGLDRTEFVLASSSDPRTDWDPELVLSEEGRNRSIEAGKRALDECMKVRELKPPSCPFIAWEEGDLVIDKSSLRFTLKNDPFKDITFRFNGANLTASANFEVTQEIRGMATKNGNRAPLIPSTQTNPARLRVQLGSGTPEASFA